MPIRIAVLPDNQARLFWDALTESLRAEPRFGITQIDSTTPIGSVVRELQPSLLVHASDHEIPTRALFDAAPGLAIMTVDESSARTIVRTSQSVPVDTRVSLDDPDFELIINVIDGLFPAGADRETEQETASRRPATPFTRDGRIAHETPPRFQDSDVAAAELAAQSWLAQVLGSHLQQMLDEEEGQPTNGWGLSTQRALNLLRELGNGPGDGRVASLLPLFWSDGAPIRSRFHWVAKVFGLSLLEQQVLLLCMAPDLDGRLSRVFGCINDDMTRRHASLSLLINLPHVSESDARKVAQLTLGGSALTKARILRPVDDPEYPVSEMPIRVSDDIARFVIGGSAALQFEYCRWHRAGDDTLAGRSTEQVRARLGRWLFGYATDSDAPALNIDPDADSRRWLLRGAAEVGLDVVEISLESLAGMPTDTVDLVLHRVARLANLLSAATLLSHPSGGDAVAGESLAAHAIDVLSERVPLFVFAGDLESPGRVRAIVRLPRPKQTRDEQADTWLDYANRLGVEMERDQALELGEWREFGEADIERTLYYALDKVMDANLFKTAARHVATTDFPPGLRRLPATFDWDDIVLPPAVMDRLRRICDHIVHREQVLNEWGYRARMGYGLGTAVLLSGPSGTGKTMAAQVIANALGDSEIAMCDLAKTVSKYIGESEKNLDAIFTAAERARAVLVFDEADVLFGKRTEIRDAHDRYANLEVGYLLQRMEAYEGLVILTTNSRASMDNAFLRRLRFVVEFPVPSAAAREEIWQRVFPAGVPLAHDVSLGYLASRLELTGGNIQQIAIMAAYAAAADGGEIEMRHVIAAAREELNKLGMDSAQRILDEAAA
ncbi:MAG: ATP-binding protein [Pseudomonadota bacterium]